MRTFRILLFHLRESAFICGLILPNVSALQSTKAFAPWKIEVATAFRYKAKAVAFEQYLKTHSGRAFSKRHF
jgi:hypothetical protein